MQRAGLGGSATTSVWRLALGQPSSILAAAPSRAGTGRDPRASRRTAAGRSAPRADAAAPVPHALARRQSRKWRYSEPARMGRDQASSAPRLGSPKPAPQPMNSSVCLSAASAEPSAHGHRRAPLVAAHAEDHRLRAPPSGRADATRLRRRPVDPLHLSAFPPGDRRPVRGLLNQAVVVGGGDRDTQIAQTPRAPRVPAAFSCPTVSRSQRRHSPPFG